MKILVHTCCAPCLIAPYQKLIEAGHNVSALWYNPNIHPLLEYQKRRDTLRDFAANRGFELLEYDEYGLHQFLQNTIDKIDQRCEYCYQSRLEKVAQLASEKGFDAFSSTLLYSRYQKHERIIEIARQMSSKYQVDFYYEDWRQLWQEGIRLSKEAAMYRQQYCGCIFSEEDRYREQIRRN
ncbi:MAG: epoxyqueuosine reductase QueH [Candidatus Cloacimonetes bacterium]|jgi:predicted adenine nucleotide alpha hydrolase (AANH) superfamily ATPase|nr:epoxyqueuosine reductase QueH [Candidatus Cloacimonadota bacterium]MDY0336464.1 epoxyqueuosine reductase QueH [Candidatus Cloacimonadaceae bacterium]MDD2543066.1 epoxyqueuosine reductase QueH [Candidatus Cloacimonadota bacterium]MDD2683987.1 epoxyqueuosine reductase QueH [Candidatus Cloacimonadota bacterium]MDD3096544.1 epoxyqueuosine reductase QueH [Candidatus Cloacimonadota bacterium]